MNLILLGKQGSGKGTVASFLAKKMNVPAISVGQLLRQKAKKDSKLARRINSGKLVSAQQAMEIVFSRLKQKDCKKGWILDGFPRDLEQVKLLHGALDIDKVLELHAPDKILRGRMTGRRICRKAGHVYHIHTMKPKRNGICDIDGSELYQREDDFPKAIRERWNEFEQNTRPVLHYYEALGLLEKVDARGKAEIVQKRSLVAVRKKKY